MAKSKSNKFVLLIILILGIVVGFQLNDFLVNNFDFESSDKINTILNYADKYYVDEVDRKELEKAAIKGMLDKLDPHSIYLPPVVQKHEEEEFRGNFDGIGIQFQVIKDTITVVSPITGGPSEAVGILPGDKIVKIEDSSAIGLADDEVIDKLRGEKGTQVNITVYRPSENIIYDFNITRDKIPLYSVDVSLLFNNNTGYIAVSKFAETTTDEVLSALNELKKEGMDKLVLDLRNNPGGYLNKAFEVADIFLDGDKLIVYTKGRLSQFNDEYSAKKDYPFENIPLIVLVNRGSASASEIVSGAIQDWDRGIIAGETTFGKGLVQRPFVLNDNSAVRLTISKYYTPSGREIQRDYSNGKEAYYSEIMNRGNNKDSADSEITSVDSLRQVYKTEGGRTIYGGGGIVPDYKIEQAAISDAAHKLRVKNLYYIYVRRYLDKNRNSVESKFKSLSEFKIGFNFTGAELDEFFKFANANGISIDRKDFYSDIDYISNRLKAYIAREFWNNKGWYYILLDYDKQFTESLKYFDEADNLLKDY